jgi:selenocysteine lyase/cysteine desulfurase
MNLGTVWQEVAAMSAPDRLASLRAREFSRLDATGQVYLDYTGSALHPDSLVRRHASLLHETVLGNPHSEHPASRYSTQLVEQARAAVLRFFDADSADYTMCFTANASAALKLVGESFAFQPGSRLVLSADNHNSVNGIREYALRRGAELEYLALDGELRLADPTRGLPPVRERGPSLFAFPAQSNFSGVKHSLKLIALAHARGYSVLLDAAAFVPTNALSLRSVQPDFVAISFYKMFGYPTGVGALLARHSALARLQRPWFAGGTIEVVTTAQPFHLPRTGPEAFEDGTPNFQAIAAIPAGLALLEHVGLADLNAHVDRLTDRLLRRLKTLRHRNGRPLVQLYGPGNLAQRGGTIAFNVLDADGRLLPFERVIQAAATHRISLRGGCFCNPGAAEAAFGHTAERSRACLARLGPAFTLARYAECMDGAPVGALRASIGLGSNQADVDALIDFLTILREATCARTRTMLALAGARTHATRHT